MVDVTGKGFYGVDLTRGGFTPEWVLVSSVCLKFKMRERGRDGLNQSRVDLIDTDASGSRSSLLLQLKCTLWCRCECVWSSHHFNFNFRSKCWISEYLLLGLFLFLFKKNLFIHFVSK